MRLLGGGGVGVGDYRKRTVVKNSSPKDRLDRLGLGACPDGRYYPRGLTNILVVDLVSWADEEAGADLARQVYL